MVLYFSPHRSSSSARTPLCGLACSVVGCWQHHALLPTPYFLPMIPASQRPDGTWRKARKIRTEGPTRYVPPALRKTDSGGDRGLTDDRARSLGDVAAVGRRGASRFLDAALFLLTTTAASSSGTTETSTAIVENSTAIVDTSTVTETSTAVPEISTAAIEISTTIIESRPEAQGKESVGGRREQGVHGSSDDEAPALPQLLVRSVARAAKEQLGCHECRPIPCETAPHRSDPGEDKNSKIDGSSDGSRGSSSSSSSSNARHGAWWAKLRLAEAGWTDEVVGGGGVAAAGRGKGDSWVGLELSLRPCDVGYTDGQMAIVGFLKGTVDERWADEGVVGLPAEAQEGTHQGEEGLNAEPVAEAGVEAGPKVNAVVGVEVTVVEAVGGREEAPRSSPDNGGDGCGAGRKGKGCDSSIGAGANNNDKGAHAEGRRRRGKGGDVTTTTSSVVTTKVAVAVLVFGSELSKRDRAELHGHAEKAGGVASSSLGVGTARFLTLTCGLGGIGAAVELKLSAEKADLARSLFRLAQQQYHSRYECLSHREIREIVALGGPNAKDHPDLFKLLQEHQEVAAAKNNRAVDAKEVTGSPGTPGEGVNAKGGKEQETVLGDVSPVVGEEQERMSDQGGGGELIAVDECPW